MQDNNDLNNALINYLMENLKDIAKCDIQEKNKDFPYIDSCNLFFNNLYKKYGISFDEKLISDSLSDLMIGELSNNLIKIK